MWSGMRPITTCLFPAVLFLTLSPRLPAAPTPTASPILGGITVIRPRSREAPWVADRVRCDRSGDSSREVRRVWETARMVADDRELRKRRSSQVGGSRRLKRDSRRVLAVGLRSHRPRAVTPELDRTEATNPGPPPDRGRHDA